MNAIKKLREIGFKKTQFHKVGYDPTTYDSMMMLDIEETKWEYKDGKRVSIKVEKKHAKSDSFWTFRYSENYILWALVKNHKIDKIWLENNFAKRIKIPGTDMYSRNTWNRSKDEERVQLIFDLSSRDSSPLVGKIQIVDIFPKEVRRNFLLEQLFGF